MPIHSYRGVLPRLGKRVFLAPDAHLSGDVEVGDDATFWFHTAARGDVNRIRIGSRSNVQDGTVLHVTHRTHQLEPEERRNIEENVERYVRLKNEYLEELGS